jgi:ABC-type sugar transport system substrate-binding protein
MKRRLIIAASMAALLVLTVMGPVLATKPGTDPDLIDGHKITICHVTNSAQNPFVVITIDIAAWQNEGDEGHSPDHHINKKTGQQDAVWDEATGTCVEGPPPEPPGSA